MNVLDYYHLNLKGTSEHFSFPFLFRFGKEFQESFVYRSKSMFAFEEIDGTDVCFFGMHVQEYGSESPAPNTR